jgi:hypothetical protein
MHAPVTQHLLYPLQGLDVGWLIDGIRLRIDGISNNCIIFVRTVFVIAVF